MTMSSGAPNQYFFRGLLQSDKGFLWQSNSNLDVALYDSKEFRLSFRLDSGLACTQGIREGRKGTGGLV